jgi:hypothetical protein
MLNNSIMSAKCLDYCKIEWQMSLFLETGTLKQLRKHNLFPNGSDKNNVKLNKKRMIKVKGQNLSQGHVRIFSTITETFSV